MNYKISSNDYAELAKFYEARGQTVKSNMLTVVPWLLTGAAGLIGFAIKEGSILGTSIPVEPWGSFVFALGAFIVCLIALLLTLEFESHTKRNWARTEAARGLLEARKDQSEYPIHPYEEVLIKATQKQPNKGLTWIFHVMMVAVILHLFASGLVMVWIMGKASP